MDCIYSSGYTFNLTCLVKPLQRLLRTFQEKKEEGKIQVLPLKVVVQSVGWTPNRTRRTGSNQGMGPWVLGWWGCDIWLLVLLVFHWNVLLRGAPRMPACSFLLFNANSRRSKLKSIPLWGPQSPTSLLNWPKQNFSWTTLCESRTRIEADTVSGFCPCSGQKLLKCCHF